MRQRETHPAARTSASSALRGDNEIVDLRGTLLFRASGPVTAATPSRSFVVARKSVPQFTHSFDPGSRRW